MKNLILIALLQILIGCGGGGGSSDDGDDSTGATSSSDSGNSGDSSGSVSSNIPTIGRCNVSAEQEELFNAHNAARAVTQDCGANGIKPPVPPLEWHCLLAESSLLHSEDMADTDFFSHTGSDGLSPFNRMDNVGYEYSTAGENIIAGYPSIDASMAGWLASDGHCSNIMNPSYTEMGAAKVDSTSAQFSNYITANFGRSR